MMIAIILGALAGAALSLCFTWTILIPASIAVMLLTVLGEIMNGHAIGVAFLSAIVSLTALQAGYLGGAIGQHSRAVRRRATKARTLSPKHHHGRA